MTFTDLCLQRESVREFAPRPIEDSKLQAVLEAVRLAPSACNKQPWHFFVLRSDEAKQKAASCHHFPWMTQAPVVLLCCIDHSQEWVRRYDDKPHGIIDIAIAVEHLCLAAADQGLGSCWICSFSAERCHQLFNLPEHLEPAALIPLGYPATDTPREKQRKPLSDIITYID